MTAVRRGAKLFGAVALGVLPLAFASPAFADTHTATLSVGPVVLPGLPAQVCIDATCTPSTALLNVGLTAQATTDVTVAPVTLTATSCPVGQLGAAIKVTSATTVSATVTATATGLGLDGQLHTVVVGPETVSVGPVGVTVSACATV
jgi:hypothetical protein